MYNVPIIPNTIIPMPFIPKQTLLISLRINVNTSPEESFLAGD